MILPLELRMRAPDDVCLSPPNDTSLPFFTRFLAQLLDRFDERGRPWSRCGEVLGTSHNHHIAHVRFSPQTVERDEGRRVRVAPFPLRRTKVTEIDISELEASMRASRD